MDSSDDVLVQITVGGKQYTPWNFGFEIPRGIFPTPSNGAAYLPATLIKGPVDSTEEEAGQFAASIFAHDDVWNEGFLKVLLVVRPNKNEMTIKYADANILEKVPIDNAAMISNGPYLIDTASGKVHTVARLFDDPFHAFLGGGIKYDPSTKKYRSLHINRYLAPSKLYNQLHLNYFKPLQGLRFAVKDVIDIAGLKTSNGSRGWLDTYPAAEESAPFIKQLTDAGAILVGKLNCTQFCDGQDPSERFEEVSPFNPRGDGYQSPSSSSSGSAVAAAAYEWIDFTVGTDTGGSIRHPAGVNGVYGIRPSLHSVETRGMTASSFMDTVGTFARSARMLQMAQHTMTAPSHQTARREVSDLRFKLLYPVRAKDAKPNTHPRWFPHPDSPPSDPNDPYSKAEALFTSFIQNLESHLNTRRHPFNLDDLWRQTHPASMDPDIAKATSSLYQTLVYHETATKVIAPFIAKHRDLHDGRTPYIEPISRKRFAYGSNVTQEAYDKAVQDFHACKEWLLNSLFATSSSSSPSQDENENGNETEIETEIPILVFPQTWGTPSYRDDSKPTPTPKEPDEEQQQQQQQIFWPGFSTYSISYASGCPDITVPVGEVPYQSRITGREEWLPVSVSVLGPPGKDRVIADVLCELEEGDILEPVEVGRRLYRW